jgi:hypothetical protein
MTCLAAGCGLLFPLFAYGYIDPGTGSYIFQIIIAVSFAVKVYWHKIKKFIGRLFRSQEK